MRIAIDAMGGDHAPLEVVKGTLQAARSLPNAQFILFGDQEAIEESLEEKLSNIEIVHTTEVITGEDEPAMSVRKKRDASMVRAARAVKNGEADAFVSCGNTGAILACGLLIIGRIKGVDRPPLTTTIPRLDGGVGTLFMDLGANADVEPENIRQFGLLGSLYAQKVLHIDQPTVGLLNNGTEKGKGNALSKDAYELLKAEEDLNFIGNIEARELLNHPADVLVTDGFTGNAVLKTMEGTVMSLVNLLKTSIKEGGFKSKAGILLLKDTLASSLGGLDLDQVGGAILLGVRAPVLKTHGSSKADAVASTLKQAVEIVESGLVSSFEEALLEKQKTPEA